MNTFSPESVTTLLGIMIVRYAYDESVSWRKEAIRQIKEQIPREQMAHFAPTARVMLEESQQGRATTGHSCDTCPGVDDCPILRTEEILAVVAATEGDREHPFNQKLYDYVQSSLDLTVLFGPELGMRMLGIPYNPVPDPEVFGAIPPQSQDGTNKVH